MQLGENHRALQAKVAAFEHPFPKPVGMRSRLPAAVSWCAGTAAWLAVFETLQWSKPRVSLTQGGRGDTLLDKKAPVIHWVLTDSY